MTRPPEPACWMGVGNRVGGARHVEYELISSQHFLVFFSRDAVAFAALAHLAICFADALGEILKLFCC